MVNGLPTAKRELLQDFLSNVRQRSYAIDKLEEPYHYYRRDSDGGLIDFKVGRDEDGDVVVAEVQWDSTKLREEEEWGVYDCMFEADELTFPEFVAVVRKQAKASMRMNDPFVDDDGDFLRGNRENAAAARSGEYDTLGREFTDETAVSPDVSFWERQTS